MDYDNLYGSLGYNISNEDLTLDEKNWLVEAIKNLDIKNKNHVYCLMLVDYNKANPNNKVIFPYKSKQVTDKIFEAKLDAMPIRLRRIIYKFVKLAQVTDILQESTTPNPV